MCTISSHPVQDTLTDKDEFHLQRKDRGDIGSVSLHTSTKINNESETSCITESLFYVK